MLEFKNYKELIAKLSDEKVCREAMEQWRWNGEPFCPLTVMALKSHAGKDFTVTAGTVFENSKIPLST